MAEARAPHHADEPAAEPDRPAEPSQTPVVRPWSTGQGGVGKTATTVHLGYAPSHPVLITDTDAAPRLAEAAPAARGALGPPFGAGNRPGRLRRR